MTGPDPSCPDLVKFADRTLIDLSPLPLLSGPQSHNFGSCEGTRTAAPAIEGDPPLLPAPTYEMIIDAIMTAEDKATLDRYLSNPESNRDNSHSLDVTLWFTRHGQTRNNFMEHAEGYIPEQDTKLSEKGRFQALQTGEKLSLLTDFGRIPTDMIVLCSPSRRAIETAQISYPGARVVALESLRELRLPEDVRKSDTVYRIPDDVHYIGTAEARETDFYYEPRYAKGGPEPREKFSDGAARFLVATEVMMKISQILFDLKMAKAAESGEEVTEDTLSRQSALAVVSHGLLLNEGLFKGLLKGSSRILYNAETVPVHYTLDALGDVGNTDTWQGTATFTGIGPSILPGPPAELRAVQSRRRSGA